VCTGKDGEIGLSNDMPWGRGLPADLAYFKKQTNGKTVVMGRKTFESILSSLGKPLPNRNNVILTKREDFQCDQVISYNSVESLLEGELDGGNKEIFIIGGGAVYQQFFDKADTVYLTKIHQNFEADTFFSELSENDWECVSSQKGITDEKNLYEYSFLVYKRRKV
jgi:dihydrofolate reductase